MFEKLDEGQRNELAKLGILGIADNQQTSKKPYQNGQKGTFDIENTNLLRFA